jgi:hypothetical protein
MCVAPYSSKRVYEPENHKKDGITKMIIGNPMERLVIRETRERTDEAWLWNLPAIVPYFDEAKGVRNCFATIKHGNVSDKGLTRESVFQQVGRLGCFNNLKVTSSKDDSKF